MHNGQFFIRNAKQPENDNGNFCSEPVLQLYSRDIATCLGILNAF